MPQTPSQKIAVASRQQEPRTEELSGLTYERFEVLVALADRMTDETNRGCITADTTVVLDDSGSCLVDSVL